MYKYNVSLRVKSSSGVRTVQVQVEHEKQWLSGGDRALKLEIIEKAAKDNGYAVEDIDFTDNSTTIDVGYGTFGLSMPDRVEKSTDNADVKKERQKSNKKSKGSKLWRIIKTIISFGMANGESLSDAKNLVDRD